MSSNLPSESPTEHTAAGLPSFAMAPRTSFMFLVLLLAVQQVASSVRASPAKDEASSEVAVDKFLQACCANTTNAVVCYNSLHPRAASFEGNLVKVTSAATVMAYARLRSFEAELRSLLREDTGAAYSVNRALESCINHFEDVLFDERDALARLRRLETTTAAFRREKQAKSDLQEVILYVSAVHDSVSLLCMEDFVRSSNGVLASPMGKMMQAGDATMQLYGGIALDLVASIKL